MTGVGITAAVAAAAAGAYFLYGTNEGKKQRKKIRGWALKAKGEVLEQLENLKEVNEEAYNKVVETVTRKYKDLKQVDPSELASMARELKGHWNSIQRELVATQKTVKKAAATGKKIVRKPRRAKKRT